MNSFKNDIKKMFIRYALLPVIVVALISYSLSLLVWYKTVVGQNELANEKVHWLVEHELDGYSKELELLASASETTAVLNGSASTNKSYEQLYAFSSSMTIMADFAICDANMRRLITNSTALVHAANWQNLLISGIGKRMNESPDKVVSAYGANVGETASSLVMGRAIVSNNRIIGYALFAIKRASMVEHITQSNSVKVYVADKFDNDIANSGGTLINQYGKIAPEYLQSTGFCYIDDELFYLTKSVIAKENLEIVTVSAVGYLAMIYLIVGILMIVLFIFFALAIFWSADRIAAQKTRDIDKIVAAIKNAQNGNFDYRLVMYSNDEFNIIAQVFNKMMFDIKQLIAQNAERAEQHARAEIKQLESQFNPHFLFNTLETIKYLARTDTLATTKVIVSLSKLLRYSINNSISDVTLAEDIIHTENYLLIQKYRFGERLNYEFSIDEGTEQCIVPKLIVQPIIENAIKYGFGAKKTLSIKVFARFSADKLLIVLEDDGVGMSATELQAVNNGIETSENTGEHNGLHSVNRRIKLMYGDNFGMFLHSEQNLCTVVTLTLPINTRG